MIPSGATNVQASRRLHSKPPAPPPPQKLKFDPLNAEIQDVPTIFSMSSRKGLIQPLQDQIKDPKGLAFRKLDEQTLANGEGTGGLQTKTNENKVSLTHSGETLLATFYGMLYTNDGAEKEWKLEVEGFIPVCFVQVHGNANKPFRIVAVEKTRRIMEYQVTVNTTCARNLTFVKWQDGVAMFGARFAKEEQAEQFLSTVKRMASTLAKAAQLLKQPERKAALRQMSDPLSSSNIHHTKVSLMIKLPDKQTTIMSVPGLLTMSELFETICEKEHLNTAEHQLSLPRIGARKVTFDSGTAVGSLKIREVSIIRTAVSDGGGGSMEIEDESIEDLLDVEGEESKILQIFLPAGTRKSYRVSVEMTMKQLVMRVCSRERLNPRHHSLQYIDFKHEFLGMTSTVDEIEVNQIRLMDKREFRKSGGVDLESDLSGNEEPRETRTSWQRSKSLDVLSNDREPEVFPEQDGQFVDKDLPRHAAANGSVPSAVRRHSSGGSTNKKPPAVPLPYVPKSSSLPQKPSRDVLNGSLKNSNLSPIKRDSVFSASTPDLSLCSAKSDDSPVSGNVKTSTPDVKAKQRRAAPRPPPRPAVPKALFADGKVDAQANRPRLLVKTSTPMPGTNPLTASTAVDAKLKPRPKKRPAPPRPPRPPPPHPARQSSTESKDSRSSEEDFGKKEDVKPQLKPRSRRPDRPALTLELDPTVASQEDEAGEDDLRGVPIFIPPPPPDELPPPLDECETPVGPLTDFEADILAGSASEGFPVTANGFVGIGKYVASSQTNENEQMQNKSAELQNATFWSNKEAALATVPEHDSISVVPPPPLYSQTPASSSSKVPVRTQPTVLSNKRDLTFNFPDLSSSETSAPSLADIPPPLLETEATSTSQDSEGKDRDSGFDQSPENLHVTPPSDSSENVAVQSWEDVDSGSSLDGINAIPPPVDFATTRPITPPCQFANATVAPSEGFVEEELTEHEPPKTQPRKKLNVSEALFPWMNEPPAPINATLPLAVSLDKEGAPEGEIPNKQQKLQNSENVPNKQGCDSASQAASASVVVPCAHDIVNQRREDQRYSGLTTEVTAEHEEQEVKATINVRDNSSIELTKSLSCDDEGTKKVEIPASKELKTAEVVVAGVSLMETELSGSHKMSDKMLNFPRPETKPKPVRSVKEDEITVEPSNSGDQRTQLFYPSMDVARQEAETVIVEEESRIKPVKPETKVKPVVSVKEKVKVQTSSVNRERTELPIKPVKLESQVKHEKQETEGEPVKEAEVKVEGHKPAVSNVSRDSTRPAFGEEAVNIEPAHPSPWINETKVHVEAHASSSSIPTADVTEKPPECEKTEVTVEPEKSETGAKPDAIVKEEEIKVELKVDVAQSFYSYGLGSEMEPPQFENVQLGMQSESEKREELQSHTVQEVIIPQLKPEVESSMKAIEKDDSEFVDSSLNEAKCEANTTLQKLTTTIVPTGTEDVVETLVTPQTKPTSSHDTLKDLEERLLELDKGSVPSSFNSRTSESKAILAAYQEPTVQSKDCFVEDVIVADTKQVEFSSYDQFQELLKLDNEDTKADEVASKENEDPRGNAIMEEQHPPYSDLHLDLSSVRKSPEPPLPPLSSPPVVAVSPRSSILPSPRELLSDRSTESGISLNENEKDFKPVQTPSAKLEVQSDPSAVSNSPTEERPSVAAKLQRPLSMPEGGHSDRANEIAADKSKSAVELDSRKSSTSESTGISSSSLPSSPVESDQQCNAELVDLPKPPPFTVPPLRRYSDLAADLSFISSAAKAAGKSHEGPSKPSAPPKPFHSSLKRSSFSVEERPRSWIGPETSKKIAEKSHEDVSKPNAPPRPVNSALKRSSFSVKEPPQSSLGPETRNNAGKLQEDVSKPSAPPKPVNSALKRSSFSVEERPRSWMGLDTNIKNTNNDNKRSLMFPSAFKPVSFDMQEKKVVRPVDFNVQPLNTPAVQSTSSANHYTVSTNKNTQAASCVEKLKEPSKPTRAVAEKPLNTSSAVQSASSANHYTVSTNKYTQAASCVEKLEEPSKPTPAVAEKLLNTSSAVPSASATNHSTVSINEKVQATNSVEKLEEPSKLTHAVGEKPEWKSTSSVVPEVPQLVKLETTTTHQSISTDAKSDPQSKKPELHKTKYEIVFSGSSSETPNVSQKNLSKTGGGLVLPSKSLSSTSSIRDQILRDATGGNRITRARPQSAIVSGSKYQCFSSDEKVSSITGANWADVKKLAALQAGSAKSGGASWVKKEASDSGKTDLAHVASKPTPPVKTADVKAKPLRGGESKPQIIKGDDDKPRQGHGDDIKKQPAKTTDITHQPVKTVADIAPQPAINNGSFPNIVMRSKTGPQDLTKRHSMPTYTIEGADRKQSLKPSGSGGQFNFVLRTVQTDTTVVPQGVVAAMKALREKKGHSEGLRVGEVDLEHTQWV